MQQIEYNVHNIYPDSYVDITRTEYLYKGSMLIYVVNNIVTCNLVI